MPVVHLLFNDQAEYLGELFTNDGAFRHAVLTPRGDEMIAPYFQEWQTRGIPVVREVAKRDPKQMTIAFYQERVPMRDLTFLWSLIRWAEERHWHILAAQPAAFECWERLAHLPLEPRERFAMALAFRDLADDELARWKECLDAAVDAVRLERMSDASNSLQKVKTLAAQGIIKKLSRV